MSLTQFARGKKVKLMTGKTVSYTSEPQTSNGHNTIIVSFNLTTGSGTWSVKVQGKAPDGNFLDLYDINGNLMSLSSVTADKMQCFKGLTDIFRIVATEDVNGATVNVGYELLTM